MTMQPSGPMPPRSNPETVLHTVVTSHTAHGYRVESLTSRSAVLVAGSACNHILHALLTFFTCGLWGPLWILLALTQKVHRITVSVNEQGQIFYNEAVGSR